MEGKLGSVRVSPGVLSTLVRLTASSVPGVLRVGRKDMGPVGRFLFRRGPRRGVELQITSDGLFIHVELVIQEGQNMLEVASRVQREISDAIEMMVGMEVREVNVLILDVR